MPFIFYFRYLLISFYPHLFPHAPHPSLYSFVHPFTPIQLPLVSLREVVSQIPKVFCGSASFPDTLDNLWQFARHQLGGCSFHESFTGDNRETLS